MFKTRLISSIVLVVLMVAGIFAGNEVFSLLFLGISLIGMFELYRIFHMEKSILAIISYVLISAFDSAIYFNVNSEILLMIVTLEIILLLASYVVVFPKYEAENVMVALCGFVYVGILLSYVIRIRSFEDGLILIWLVFICSWINDTCAYCVGVLIGKHKMTPKLSPKKSVEGAIGGIIGTALIAGLYGYIFFGHFTKVTSPVLLCAIAGSLGAIISIFGDLAASGIKRNKGIKDYGRLIPGHGGILDRFDSVILTAPIVYYVFLLLSQV